MTIVWPGTVGDSFTNTGEKILYQFVCSLINTCGLCYQYHLAVAKWWPKMHFGCNCQSTPIYPGQASAPYEDWRRIIADLDPEQQAKVVGKANLILINQGIVKWEDVVTSNRVRLLREVVSRHQLDVATMVKAGVKLNTANHAFATVNTPAHQLAAQQRTQLITQIQQLGIQPKHLTEMFGQRMAQRIGIGEGPSGKSTMPAGRSDINWRRVLRRALVATGGTAAAAVARPVGETEATVDWEGDSLSQARQWFGSDATEKQLASLSGAPDDATVTVRTSGPDKLNFRIEHPAYDGASQRTITRHANGTITIHNDILKIKPEYRKFWTVDAAGNRIEARFAWHGTDPTQPFTRPPDFERYQHLGREVFMRQIEAAYKLGIKSIDTYAFRNPGSTITDLSGNRHETWNGYYTWPRFGYDAALEPSVRARLAQSSLSPEVRQAKRFKQLFETEEGRNWWKENGEAVDVTFHLGKYSYSMKTLRDYLKRNR